MKRTNTKNKVTLPGVESQVTATDSDSQQQSISVYQIRGAVVASQGYATRAVFRCGREGPRPQASHFLLTFGGLAFEKVVKFV